MNHPLIFKIFILCNNIQMDIVNYKNSLATHVKQKTTIQDIIQKVLTIPEVTNLKNDVELIRYVANVIENVFSNEPIETKKAYVIQVLTAVHPMNDEELVLLGSTIEFLNKIGKVKARSFLKYISKTAYNWIVKKLG